MSYRLLSRLFFPTLGGLVAVLCLTAPLACSNESSDGDRASPASDENEATTDGDEAASTESGSNSANPTKPGSDGGDGLGEKGGAICEARCEKAACPDLEACEALCAKDEAQIPPSCDSSVDALETCVDTKGTWKCVSGEAKASGDCTNEAFAVFDCVLAAALDAGSDAQADGSL